MFELAWLRSLSEFLRNRSFGLAAIRVLDYGDTTYGIIDPYGYYVVNYKSEIYLLRDLNVAIKFFIKNKTVATSIVHSLYTVGLIDSLFSNPPSSSSKITKFILFTDNQPRRYTAIQLINRCLDLRVLDLSSSSSNDIDSGF